MQNNASITAQVAAHINANSSGQTLEDALNDLGELSAEEAMNKVVVVSGDADADKRMMAGLSDRSQLVSALMALGAGPGIHSMIKDDDFRVELKDPTTPESIAAMQSAQEKRERRALKRVKQSGN